MVISTKMEHRSCIQNIISVHKKIRDVSYDTLLSVEESGGVGQCLDEHEPAVYPGG